MIFERIEDRQARSETLVQALLWFAAITARRGESA
jgi:hypothetical protein